MQATAIFLQFRTMSRDRTFQPVYDKITYNNKCVVICSMYKVHCRRPQIANKQTTCINKNTRCFLLIVSLSFTQFCTSTNINLYKYMQRAAHETDSFVLSRRRTKICLLSKWLTPAAFSIKQRYKQKNYSLNSLAAFKYHSHRYLCLRRHPGKFIAKCVNGDNVLALECKYVYLKLSVV